MTVKELIKHLQKDYKPNDVIAYDIWTVQDVEQAISDRAYVPKLTKEQMVEVIDQLEVHKDANYGITWEHVYDWIRSIGSNGEGK